MEQLAGLTAIDIQNGVLQHLLASAGIPNVNEYVNQFHVDTEHLFIEDFEQSQPNDDDDVPDEQIVPPAHIRVWFNYIRPYLDATAQQAALGQQENFPPPSPVSIATDQPRVLKDLSSWMGGFRPQTDDNAPAAAPSVPQAPSTPEPPPGPPPPRDLSSWMGGFRPQTDDNAPTAAPSVPQPPPGPPPPRDVSGWVGGFRPQTDDDAARAAPSSPKPPPGPPPPKDVSSWAQGIVPDRLSGEMDLNSSASSASPGADGPSSNRHVSGDLGTWLRDWSINIAQQPPPTSLDTWLKGLIATDLHEPIDKKGSAKKRLNSYLNAAQEVLSKHGYNVSGTEIESTPLPKEKTGFFGNVKQMYFLWKVLDKNHDRKITVEDVQILLQELGLGFLSKNLAQTVFEMVDTNHDGQLQFRDFIAFMSIIKQLISAAKAPKA